MCCCNIWGVITMDIISMVCVAVGVVAVAWFIDYHLDLDGSYGKEYEDTQ